VLYQLSYGHHKLQRSRRSLTAPLPDFPGCTIAGQVSGKMVGVERFELPTSCSQSRRATRLRYTPIFKRLFEACSPKSGRHHTD
jgi:hypothetical protein